MSKHIFFSELERKEIGTSGMGTGNIGEVMELELATVILGQDASWVINTKRRSVQRSREILIMMTNTMITKIKCYRGNP